MAPRFATVSKDKNLAVNEAAAPADTGKETKFGLSVFTGRYPSGLVHSARYIPRRFASQCTLTTFHLPFGG